MNKRKECDNCNCNNEEFKAVLEEIRDLLIPLSNKAKYEIQQINESKQIAQIKDKLFTDWVEEQKAKKDEQEKEDDKS